MNCFWINPLAIARSTSALAAASPIFTFTITVRRSSRTIARGQRPPRVTHDLSQQVCRRRLGDFELLRGIRSYAFMICRVD